MRVAASLLKDKKDLTLYGNLFFPKKPRLGILTGT